MSKICHVLCCVILMSKTGLDGPLRSVHILTTLMKGWIEKLLLGRNIPEMQDVQVILRMRDFPWKIGFSTSSNCHAAIFVAAIWEEKWLSYIFWGLTQRHHSAPHKWLIINGFGVKILALCSEFCVFSMVQVFIVEKPMAMHRRLKLRSPIEI